MKSFNSLVGSGTLATLQDNRQIRKLMSQIVPASTLEHVTFFRVQGGRLRVTVRSAAWVARLRFSEGEFIRLLREHNRNVYTVSWHVSPEQSPPPRRTQRQANSASEASEQTLRALANTPLPSSGTPEENSAQHTLRQSTKPARSSTLTNSTLTQKRRSVIRDGVEQVQDERLRQELIRLASNLSRSREKKQQS